ncbi:hypothetical protein [Oenococcus alcoholitolerans]|uniref:hypothetical protein n=1 Tax=Oenococcus alcoholitolerans TaxID=931074 RepID=UPI003F707B8D
MVDRYGRDHGDITGTFIIVFIPTWQYVMSAFKTHINKTPSLSKARCFFKYSDAEMFLDEHAMGYEYKTIKRPYL